MLVKAIKIDRPLHPTTGRHYNTTVLFAYDPVEVVTVENVSHDYMGAYDSAVRVTFKNGESAILKNTVQEMIDIRAGVVI